MILYAKGEPIECDPGQVEILLKAGWTKERPPPAKKPVSETRERPTPKTSPGK
jgi:hypothetical protein